jgi:hypothetical protein
VDSTRKAGCAVKKRYIAIAVIAVVIGGAAIAYAAIPDSKGIIHGCRNNGSGVLRVIDSGQSCSPAETALDWVQSAGFEVYRSPGFSPPIEITAVAPADFQHVMTLTLQPGSYEISTSVEAQKDSGDGELACLTFTAPGFVTSLLRSAMGTDPGDSRFLRGKRPQRHCRQNGLLSRFSGSTPVTKRVYADLG